MKDATEHGAKPRYAFASDLDGDLCLIAPLGTSDWSDWRVIGIDRDGVRSAVEPDAGGFGGHVHRDAEASWSLEWLAHIEVAIPGEEVIVMHPGVFAPDPCPLCGYRGGRQMPRAGNYAPSQRPPGVGSERKDRAVSREQLEPGGRSRWGEPRCMTAIGNMLVVASSRGLLIRDEAGGSTWVDLVDTNVSADNPPQLLVPLWDAQFLLADSHYGGAYRFDLFGKCLGLLGHGGGLDDWIENVVVDPQARAFIARSGSELIHWSEKNGVSTDALGRDEALAIVSVDQGRLCECLWTSHDDEDEEPAWIHTLETATGRLVDNRPGPRIISAGNIDLAVSLPTGEALVVTDAWNNDAHVYRRSSDGTWHAQGEKPGALRWDFILLRGTLDALAAEDGPICLKSSGQVLPCPNLPRDAKLAQLENGLVACVSKHWELSLWEPETLCGAE